MVTPEMVAAAWDAWSPRRGDPDRKLGPGPAFKEAVAAALVVALRDGVLVTAADHVDVSQKLFDSLEVVEMYSTATQVAQAEAEKLRKRVEELEDTLDDLQDRQLDH